MIVEKMCETIKPIMTAIFQQPFIKELSAGTLAKETFAFYIAQDALYLAEFSKALAFTAARFDQMETTIQFTQFALDAVKAEGELHTSYLQAFQANQLNSMPQSPACFMYANYLIKMSASATVEEAVASLLPCFWIYREVGKKILQTHQATNNPYQQWIDLYSSEQFDLGVKLAVEVTNQLAQLTTPAIQEKMIATFVRSSQLEWLFWDSAYRQEKWMI